MKASYPNQARWYDGSIVSTSLCKLWFSTGCNITVKAEYLNPGGSVKDRAALYLLKDAEEKGFAI